jgi:hypothetical protein
MPAAKKLTDKDKKLIKKLAAKGISQENISDLFGICRQTLAKICPEELKSGKAGMLDLATDSLFNNIKKGCITSICFYLKTQHGWRDRADSSSGSNVPEVIMFKRAADPQ